jgi:hypothetical protein
MAVTQGIDRLRTARYNRGMENILTTSAVCLFPLLMLVRELFRNYTPELFDNSFRLVQKLSPSCSGIS